MFCNETIPCGKRARCFENLCTCDNGYFINEDFLSEDVLDCSGDKAALMFLYILAITLCVVCVWLHVRHLKRWSQLRRLSAFLLANAVQLIFIVRKLSGLDSIFFGHDITVTFFFAVSIPFMNIGSHIFLGKYIIIQYRTFFFKDDRAMKVVRWLDRLLFLSDFFSLLGASLIISTAIHDYNTVTHVWKVALASWSLCGLINSASWVYLTGLLRKDLGSIGKQYPDAKKLQRQIDGIKSSEAVGNLMFFLILGVIAVIPGDISLVIFQYAFFFLSYSFWLGTIGAVLFKSTKTKSTLGQTSNKNNSSKALITNV